MTSPGPENGRRDEPAPGGWCETENVSAVFAAIEGVVDTTVRPMREVIRRHLQSEQPPPPPETPPGARS